jgi:hypothetical protein
MGLRPRVHEAYRSPAESDRKNKLSKEKTADGKKKGGRAAPGWSSCHNYGLAMDVYLYDRKGAYIDNHVRGWYKQYKLLASAAVDLVWGAAFDDADHFEFHPNWGGGAKGKMLHGVKNWAEQAAMAISGASVLADGAIGPVPEPEPNAWLPYFWWAAGAGGVAPAPQFLASNPLPSTG